MGVVLFLGFVREGGVAVLYWFQLFAENGSLCVCVQLYPVNAGVREVAVL
jgi:hypothetical protein